MDKQIIQKFGVIGIAVRTTNENEQAGVDIAALWNRFITEEVIGKIPDKIDDSVYCIYTDYEKDYTKPYTTILGCKVKNLNSIPEGMTGRTIEEAIYIKYTVKGSMLQGMVFNEWKKIWNSDLQRTYTADFEVYGEKTKNPENAEVDIFIAIK